MPPRQTKNGKNRYNNDKSDDGSDNEVEVKGDSDCELPEYSLTEEQEKRYRYLLGDSELFDRFIEAKRRGDSPLEVLTHHTSANSSSHKDDENRRHRKTENDEDADLIEEATSGEASFSFTESPAYVEGGKMRPYQVQGLNWLISLYDNHVNGILADEMGLGKTLQTLSLLGYLKNFKQVNGPHLLVVPKSTLQNWLNESKRWVPSLNSFIFHGDKETRANLIQQRLRPLSFDVCITSYEVCLSERAALRRVKWEYLIIDEAHRIKNEASKLALIVREFKSSSRLLITGTPLQNNLHELWALLNFLLPDIFSSSDDFDEWFKSNGSKAQDEMVSHLRRLLQPFLLRRLKADVEHSLKPKKEVNLYVGMTEMQSQWYRRILERDLGAINGLVKGNKEGKVRLLNIVMQLRKCCNHPYLFDGAEPGPPFTTDEHLVQNAGKMQVLDKLLTRLKENGSRVLLFSQMSRVLDILEDYCVFRGYEYCRIDGQTAHEDRIEAIDEYNRPGSDKFIFLLTTRAGGLGINLATADIVILYDSDWNPQVDLQAQDRAHRIGQTKQVCVFRFVTEHSIEEKIIEKALQKLRLDQLVIQQGKLTNVNKTLSQDEMLSMIRHGAERILSHPDVKQNVEFDIEDLLRKGEERTKELLGKYQNVGYDDLQKFTIEAPSLPLLESLDQSDANNYSIDSLLFLAPSKRERKGTFHVDGYFKQTLRIHPPKPKPSKPPMPKDHIIIHDFQFYPPRLQELVDREVLAHQKSVDYKTPDGGAEETEEEKEERLAQQAAIDNAVPLTEEEQMEKRNLASQGFSQWLRRDYITFLKGIEKYGKDAHKHVEIEGKTAEEISQYSSVFWNNLEKLADYEKIEAYLDAHEAKVRRDKEIMSCLSRKINGHKRSHTPLHITYFTGKGKQFTDEEDIFLIEQLADIGVTRPDAMEVLRDRILRAPQFRFNWFLKTRTAVDLQRRCNKLISFIEREFKGLEERQEPPKGRARALWEKDSKRSADASTMNTVAKSKKKSK